MMRDPKTDPIPAPDPATPTVAAPAPMNLAAMIHNSIHLLTFKTKEQTGVNVSGCLGCLKAPNSGYRWLRQSLEHGTATGGQGETSNSRHCRVL